MTHDAAMAPSVSVRTQAHLCLGALQCLCSSSTSAQMLMQFRPNTLQLYVTVSQIHFWNRTVLEVSSNSSICWNTQVKGLPDVGSSLPSNHKERSRFMLVCIPSIKLYPAVRGMSLLHEHKLFDWYLITSFQLLEEQNMFQQESFLLQSYMNSCSRDKWYRKKPDAQLLWCMNVI